MFENDCTKKISNFAISRFILKIICKYISEFQRSEVYPFLPSWKAYRQSYGTP